MKTSGSQPAASTPEPKRDLPKGPVTNTDNFQFMAHINQVLLNKFGADYVAEKYAVDMLLDTVFSGIDCPAAAAMALQSASRDFGGRGLNVEVGIAADKEQHRRIVQRDTLHGRRERHGG